MSRRQWAKGSIIADLVDALEELVALRNAVAEAGGMEGPLATETITTFAHRQMASYDNARRVIARARELANDEVSEFEPGETVMLRQNRMRRWGGPAIILRREQHGRYLVQRIGELQGNHSRMILIWPAEIVGGPKRKRTPTAHRDSMTDREACPGRAKVEEGA